MIPFNNRLFPEAMLFNLKAIQTVDSGLLGRREANLCFHFAGSGENLPDITKSRDAILHNKISFLF